MRVKVTLNELIKSPYTENNYNYVTGTIIDEISSTDLITYINSPAELAKMLESKQFILIQEEHDYEHRIKDCISKIRFYSMLSIRKIEIIVPDID